MSLTLDHLRAGRRAVEEATSAGELETPPKGCVVLQDDPTYTIERGDAELLRAYLYARRAATHERLHAAAAATQCRNRPQWIEDGRRRYCRS